MSLGRRAFTLFEALIAALILASAILLVIGLFPVGIKAQQESRYRMFAAAKAMEVTTYLASQQTNAEYARLDMVEAGSGGLLIGKPYQRWGGDDSRTALQHRMVESGIYDAPSAPDLEQVLMLGSLGAIPVPMEIARRLDAPGDEIRKALDAGGVLFYANPAAITGDLGTIRATATQSGKNDYRKLFGDEAQRVVFAVVGQPQQNLLPAMPTHAWPYYELYPFPPQSYQSGLQRECKLVATSSYDLELEVDGKTVTHRVRYAWVEVPESDSAIWRYQDFAPAGYQAGNWMFMAAHDPASPWAASRTAYLELLEWGWQPVRFKIACGNWTGFRGTKGVSPAPSNVREDNGLPAVPPEALPLPGGNLGYGIALNHAARDFYKRTATTSTPLEPGAVAGGGSWSTDLRLPPSVWRMAQTHLNAWCQANGTTQFDWNQEWGTDSEPRLPSLGARRFYRTLAARLWAHAAEGEAALTAGMVDDATADCGRLAFTSAGPVGTANPMTRLFTMDELMANPRWLHPARVLALSHLAHAAMMVTGVGGPMINENVAWEADPRSKRMEPDDNPLATDGRLRNQADNDTDIAGRAPGNAAEASGVTPSGTVMPPTPQDGPLRSQSLPLAVEVAWARTLHENSLRWAMAYAASFPNDTLAPRPANRQLATDRQLLVWDLFDGSGRAMRQGLLTGSFPEPGGGTVGSREAWYQVLDGPFGGSAPYRGMARHFGLGADFHHGPQDSVWQTTDDKDGGKIYRWSDLVSGRPGLHAAFQPVEAPDAHQSARYWPARPFAAAQRCRQLVFWAVNWKEFEDAETAPMVPMDASFSLRSWRLSDRRGWGIPPEAHLLWQDERRQNIRYEPDGSQQQRAGAWGADRNGDGSLTIGSIPAGNRLRAVPVDRFTFYDPVGYLCPDR